MTKTLKPCIFCGSDLVVLKKYIILDAKRINVCCLGCGIAVYHMDHEDYFDDINVVITKWNRRHNGNLKLCKHGNSPVGIYQGIWFWKRFYMACWRCDCEGPKCKTSLESISEWNKRQ